MASGASIKAGAAYVEITARTAKLQQGLKKTQDMFRNFGYAVSKIGIDMSIMGSMAGLPLAHAVKTFADFNDKIRLLKSLTGATAPEIKKFEGYIRKLGATTSFTASQVAQGMIELSRLGFNKSEVEQGIKPVLDLTRATGEEMHRLGDITEYAAATLRNFNLPASQFADVCDVLAKGANDSAMDINDMGEAMKIAAPSAHTVGEDLRDVASALMLLSNAGIKGTLAGTSLRKLYQSLAAQTEEGMAGRYSLERDFNIKVTDENGNLRKVRDIMYELSGVARDLKTGKKINMATDIFDLRGSLGALTMINNPGSAQKMYDALSRNVTSGYAANLAKDMESGIGGMFRKILAGLNEVKLTIGEVFEQGFSDFLLDLLNILKGTAKWMKENKSLVNSIIAVVGSVASMGAALSVVGGALKLVGYGAGVFAKINAALKPLNDRFSGAAAASRAMAEQQKKQAEAAQNAARLKELAQKKADANQHVSDMQNKLTQVSDKRQNAINKTRDEAQKLVNIKNTMAGQKNYNSLVEKQEKVVKRASNQVRKFAGEQIKLNNSLSNAVMLSQQTATAYQHEINMQKHRAKNLGTITASEQRVFKVRQNILGVLKQHRDLVLKASVADMVAATRTANATKMQIAQLYAQASAAKVAAGATRAIGAAMSWVAANPLTAAIIGFTAVSAAISAYNKKAANIAVAEFDVSMKSVNYASQYYDELLAQHKKEEEMLARLNELEQKGVLDNVEYTEAVKLVNDLAKAYKDCGYYVNEYSRSIKKSKNAEKNISGEQIKNEADAMERKIDALEEAIATKMGVIRQKADERYGTGVLAAYKGMVGFGKDNALYYSVGGIEKRGFHGNRYENISPQKMLSGLMAYEETQGDYTLSSDRESLANLIKERDQIIDEREKLVEKYNNIQKNVTQKPAIQNKYKNILSEEKLNTLLKERMKIEDSLFTKKKSQTRQELEALEEQKRAYLKNIAAQRKSLNEKIALNNDAYKRYEKNGLGLSHDALTIKDTINVLNEEIQNLKNEEKNTLSFFDKKRDVILSEERKYAASISDFSGNLESEYTAKREKSRIDDSISESFDKKDYDAAYQIAKAEYDKNMQSYNDSKNNLLKTLNKVQSVRSSEGERITDSEKQILDEIKSLVQQYRSSAEEYFEKMQEAQKGMNAAVNNIEYRTLGSYSAENLSRMMAPEGTIENIAKSILEETKRMIDEQKKTNKYLKTDSGNTLVFS